MNTAAFELAICFPPHLGYRGACSNVEDLCRYFRHGIGYPTKARAVGFVMQAEFFRVMARGNGNRAARKQAQVEAIFEARQDDDSMELVAHEDDTEFRSEARPHFYDHTNPHE